MATTTNYGWTTPDDTDLVKDGAAAIRTLGSSVDTTTKALNPSTTEGDIEYRSATADTNSRLAIGTAGQVLQVNSGATAPEWATPAGGGGMTLLSTTTLSGATTTISGIDQTYTNLEIFVFNPAQSAASTIQFEVERAAFAHDVSYAGATQTSGTFAVSGGNNATNIVTRQQLATATSNSSFVWTLYQYAATGNRKGVQFISNYLASSGNQCSEFFGGGYTSASNAAFSTVKIKSTGSSFTGGTVLIYGVK